MKGSVGLLSIAMRMIDFEAIFYQLCLVLNWFSQLHLTLTWSIFCNQENIVWSTRNPFSSFRINNCFCQIQLQSVFEVAFYYQKQSAIAFYYQKQCHIINPLLTALARAVLGNIGPRSWQYGPRFARSVLPRPRANIPQYGPRARLVSGYYFPLAEWYEISGKCFSHTPLGAWEYAIWPLVGSLFCCISHYRPVFPPSHP